MIELNDTCDTIVMLLVAAGVGLLGGVGAALLEVRRDPEKAKGFLQLIFSSIVLGGIAAVAILYFFPPEETKEVVVNGTTELVTGYNLTKLVALALIVGSAGAAFLLVLHKKSLDLTEAQKEVAVKAEEVAKKEGEARALQVQATEAMRGVGNQAKTLAKSSVVQSVEPMIRKALEDVSSGPVSQETVATVAQELGDQAGSAVEKSIDPVVEGAQKRILAADVTSSGDDELGGAEK